MSNILISTSYNLIKKIGKGSFGEVYLISDHVGNEYACKTEKNNVKNRLKGEFLIYKRFATKNLECVPKIRCYLETPEYNLLIMQLLGKGLDTIFEECNSKIDVGTVMKIGINIINHLERIHRIGIIHRDIKPNNFMFGIKDNTADNTNNLYIMDFGLSRKWYVNGDHIEYTTGRSMIGTARYASMNIHYGSEPSRRDDMESVGYMLVYLAKGSLPWQGMKKKVKGDQVDMIGEKKMSVDLHDLCRGLPDCFYEYINYCRNLQFTEKPDYEYLRDLFTTSAKDYNINLKYFWEEGGIGSSISTTIERINNEEHREIPPFSLFKHSYTNNLKISKPLQTSTSTPVLQKPLQSIRIPTTNTQFNTQFNTQLNKQNNKIHPLPQGNFRTRRYAGRTIKTTPTKEDTSDINSNDDCIHQNKNRHSIDELSSSSSAKRRTRRSRKRKN